MVPTRFFLTHVEKTVKIINEEVGLIIMKKVILLYCLSFFIILNVCAQESSKEIPKLDKKDINNEIISCYRLGIVYGLNGMYDDAIKYLKEAVKLDPLFSEAYRILGIVYSLQNNYPEAIKNLEKAIQIDPKSKDAYRILKVISGLKDATDKLKELSVQEEEYKRLEEKGDIKKDYGEIKVTLNKMEKEIEKLKRNQYENKREHLAPEVYEKSEEREKLRVKPSKDIKASKDIKPREDSKAPEYEKEKGVKRMKCFAEILEEEREVAFDEEKVAYQPKAVSLKDRLIKSNYVESKKIPELTIISLQSLWKKGKEKQIFCIEGELENTGFSCVHKPKISAKFFYKNQLVGVANCQPKSKIDVGEIAEFRLSLPIPKNFQEELSYQLTIEEDELDLSKKRSIQLFMMVDGRKIEMPIIFQ